MWHIWFRKHLFSKPLLMLVVFFHLLITITHRLIPSPLLEFSLLLLNLKKLKRILECKLLSTSVPNTKTSEALSLQFLLQKERKSIKIIFNIAAYLYHSKIYLSSFCVWNCGRYIFWVYYESSKKACRKSTNSKSCQNYPCSVPCFFWKMTP